MEVRSCRQRSVKKDKWRRGVEDKDKKVRSRTSGNEELKTETEM